MKKLVLILVALSFSCSKDDAPAPPTPAPASPSVYYYQVHGVNSVDIEYINEFGALVSDIVPDEWVYEWKQNGSRKLMIRASNHIEPNATLIPAHLGVELYKDGKLIEKQFSYDSDSGTFRLQVEINGSY